MREIVETRKIMPIDFQYLCQRYGWYKGAESLTENAAYQDALRRINVEEATTGLLEEIAQSVIDNTAGLPIRFGLLEIMYELAKISYSTFGYRKVPAGGRPETDAQGK